MYCMRPIEATPGEFCRYLYWLVPCAPKTEDDDDDDDDDGDIDDYDDDVDE